MLKGFTPVFVRGLYDTVGHISINVVSGYILKKDTHYIEHMLIDSGYNMGILIWHTCTQNIDSWINMTKK